MIIFTTSDEKAKAELKQALEEKNIIKMLVFGAGSTENDIAKKACNRAQALPMREVIWVQNLEILTEDEKNYYQQGDDSIAVCTLDFQGKPIKFLKLSEATSNTKLEQAFTAAGKNL